MVGFKTFEDFHKFLKEYAVCSCLNCVGYYGDDNCNQFICMKTLSPVRFELLHLCVEWENKDGKVLDDYSNQKRWKFSDETAEKLEVLENATFEEIKEIVENEGK